MSRFLGTGLRFESRPLPTDDAAAFVLASLKSVRQRHSAVVVLNMPLDQMRQHFRSWSKDAVAADATHTRWPISAESLEMLLAALVWIPPGVSYEIEAAPDFLAFAADAAARLRNGVPAPIGTG